MLDTPVTPKPDTWDQQERTLAQNTDRILDLLANTGQVATFFWLGWAAERYSEVLRRCRDAGHEIGSHGYGHLLAYQVGPDAYRQDLTRGKTIIEDIIGQEVPGFRAPGFGITDDSPWAFEVIREVGHRYDSSAFPTARGHGGMLSAPMDPYPIETPAGKLWEVPMSVVKIMGKRVCLFSGGYLRLAPLGLVRWGIRRLRKENRSLILLIHPREVDPTHPRLKLPLKRRFKCYVNLKSTLPKIEWICRNVPLNTMTDVVDWWSDRHDQPG